MKCDVCEGKGFVGPKDTPNQFWANRCTICGGTGTITFGRIAELLIEPRSTIVSVYRLRARPKTARRVFEGVTRLLGWEKPVKQKEMFG